MEKKVIGGIAITFLSVALAAVFAVTHGEAVSSAIGMLSWPALFALLFIHGIYVLINSELWFVSMREAEPEIDRRSIYTSFFISSFLLPLSTPLGMAFQVGMLKKIAPESHVGHAVTSLAPIIWVKATISTVIIAGILFSLNVSIGFALIGLAALAALGLSMYVLEAKTRDKDFLHGLAVVRNPKSLGIMGGLITLSLALQVVKFGIALTVMGVPIEALALVGAVIGQGVAGPLPLLAGPGSAALVFSSSAMDAASAALTVSATALVAGFLITLATIPSAVSLFSTHSVGERAPAATRD